MTRQQLCLSLLLLCLTVAGTGCESMRQLLQPRPTVILDTNPQLATVANIVNQNSAKVVSLQSNSARISASGMPVSLNANLALRRDRRFRLKADTALSGTEVDLGSNDQLFWVWIRRGDPKALYFCEHSKFHQSAAQSILPVQPEWLIEAFGLTSLDPNVNYIGPEPVGKNRLRISRVFQTPRGLMTKATVLDARYGDVLEQHLYDGNQQLVASALTSDHTKYVLQDQQEVYLPHNVQLVFPQTNMTLTIDVSSYELNKIGPDAGLALWELPDIPGYPLVNLADPKLQLSPMPGMAPSTGQPTMQQYGGQSYGTQPANGIPNNAAPGGGRAYGVQYGGSVAPASYPTGSSQGFRPPSSTLQRANYPPESGAAVGAAMSETMETESSTSDEHENRRETIVSPPASYGPQPLWR